ncbi:MAG: hypothetical protein BRC29_01445 [Nanohaloarchaea archaeon SW_7_43_1]|nr:MAG: hypothetical protein BRC29_01445 [Nanohaloarchaea archaeon SW_7_43_1]
MFSMISVSDDVYEWMKRKKMDRSFSELIRDLMKGSDLRELEDIGFSEGWETLDEKVKKSSDKTWDRIENLEVIDWNKI